MFEWWLVYLRIDITDLPRMVVSDTQDASDDSEETCRCSWMEY